MEEEQQKKEQEEQSQSQKSEETRCSYCGSKLTYFRIKTAETVCRSCGKTKGVNK